MRPRSSQDTHRIHGLALAGRRTMSCLTSACSCSIPSATTPSCTRSIILRRRDRSFGRSRNRRQAAKFRTEPVGSCPLTAYHNVSGFDCGEPALNDWLRHRALKNESRFSRTYVVCDDDKRVVAYFCVSTGAVERAAAPGKVRRNTPDTIPASVIGRLAVNRDHTGKGFGTDLLADALRRIAVALQSIGAVLVHAKVGATKRFYLRCAMCGVHRVSGRQPNLIPPHRNRCRSFQLRSIAIRRSKMEKQKRAQAAWPDRTIFAASLISIKIRWRDSLGSRYGDVPIDPQVLHSSRSGICQPAGDSRKLESGHHHSRGQRAE